MTTASMTHEEALRAAHDERCDLEDALNAVIYAEGITGAADARYWPRRRELMAAGAQWRARVERGDL